MADGILSGLNPRQREAVEAISGPVLIVAGPGSGKTRVITHRIAYLVETCGVSPYRIAAVTFTNKAAREMRERAATLIRTRNDQLTISTFHAFCARVLRRDGERVGLDENFAIYDQADQTSVMKQAMAEVDIDEKRFRPGSILSAISWAKSQLTGVDAYGLGKFDYFGENVHRAYQRYEELLDQASALDFDDLIFKVHKLFREHPDVVELYRERYVHVMIDEFQDTNVAQYEVAKQLAGGYRNLCVVGDPNQAIYSWRNADVRNILSFQADFGDARVISLEENYRSTKTILEAARNVIAPNRSRLEHSLFTARGEGVPIVVHEGYDENDEAQFVVGEIERLVRNGLSLSDIAVMYRMNAQSRALEEACMRYGVPYQLVGSIRFYQRQEIKDLVSYLRLIANHNDDVSFRRIVNVPARGIGQRTMDELMRYARDYGVSLYEAIDGIAETVDGSATFTFPLPPRSAKALQGFKAMIVELAEKSANADLVTLIDAVLERTGYKDYIESEPERGEERRENILEFQASAKKFLYEGLGDILTAFLEQVSLVSDVDNVDERAAAAVLITLHQAKGLEFPVVFIVGMEEGLLPHSRSLDSGDPDAIEEERRLCYVGVTRAKEKLYLVRAFRRGFRGRRGYEPAMPSRFLADIPQDLLTKRATHPGQRQAARLERRDSPASPRPRVDEPGERVVRHTRGTVIRRRRGDASLAPKGAPSPLSTGDRVRHKTFGEGIVTATKPSGGDTEITVAFKEGQGVKRLLLSFAPIERVE